MNINIKNCDVNITGTETLEISGKTEITAADKTPATNTESTPAEETGVISQMTYTPQSVLKNFDNVRIGDRVRLPAFTVPAVKMDGENVLAFDEKYIYADEAIVIGKDKNGDLILIFDHCLFESAIDLNNEKRFEMTQLGKYLQGEFLRAMNGAGIPAESCGLISKEEMFGDNALEYFKTGRNRIAFDCDEDYSRYYWLATFHDEETSAAYFCIALSRGYADYNSASAACTYVRPRFIIHNLQE